MNKDIVCSESELSSAVNKITNYIDHLTYTLENYINVLNRVNENGIEDATVNSQIVDIIDELAPLRDALRISGEMISKNVKNNISNIENYDDFKFPADEISAIRILLGVLF